MLALLAVQARPSNVHQGTEDDWADLGDFHCRRVGHVGVFHLCGDGLVVMSSPLKKSPHVFPSVIEEVFGHRVPTFERQHVVVEAEFAYSCRPPPVDGMIPQSPRRACSVGVHRGLGIPTSGLLPCRGHWLRWE